MILTLHCLLVLSTSVLDMHFCINELPPEAQVAKLGKKPYLEEENSDLVVVRRVRDIKSCMSSVFCHLVSKKQALLSSLACISST
jgi:hypothetical protein